MRSLWPIVVAAILLTGCGQAQVSPDAVGRIDISVSDCGSSWRPTAAGSQDLALHNADSRPGEVQVIGRGKQRGLVYADVEPFGPGTTVRVQVPLAAGSYALACLMEDGADATGPTRSLTGNAHGAPGVRAVTEQQLIRPAQRYQSWLRRQLPRLLRDCRLLRARVAAGELRGARVAWLAAHGDYQRLGAAYDAFGALGDRIDGLRQGLPRGTDDRGFTGFHRVEQDLWHAVGARQTVADTRVLVRAVARLPALLARTQIDPATLTIRAHEIAENALQFQLTGADDQGSHSDLASIRAELGGTAAVLRVLARPIRMRVAHAGAILRRLTRTRTIVHRAAAGFPGVRVSRLPRLVRERLDAALGELCERLSPIAATLEPRLVVTGSDGSPS
jgi:iron uptake system component EfeO